MKKTISVLTLTGLSFGTLSVASVSQAAAYATESFKFSTSVGDLTVGSGSILAALEGRFKARKQNLSLAQLRQVPLSITVTSTAGKVKLNFLDLNLALLNVQTVTGDVNMTVKGIGKTRTKTQVSTQGGRVQLQISGQASDLMLKSSVGDVNLTLNGGSETADRLEFQGSAAKLTVKSKSYLEALKLKTITGDVDLELNSKSNRGTRLEFEGNAAQLNLKGNALLEQLNIQTQTGDVNVWLPGQGKTQANFSSSAGKLTVYVPRSRSVQLDNPQTTAGNIEVSSAVDQGNTNPNSAVFKIVTVTGDVDVLPLEQ